jgi:hypothetical protein
MKLLRRHLLIACIVAAAVSGASGQFAAQPTSDKKESSETAGPTYRTAKEITAMPPRTATFAKRLSEYSGSFTDANGKGFVVGDIRGEQRVWHFVNALTEGQAYKLPNAFLNYQAAPHYVTAKEIAAMAPCTAMLASRSPCSSYFTTADGKWFGIGDPSSEEEISHFIWSQKLGEANKFPDAFLAYQAAPHYATASEITEMAPCTATLVHEWNGSGYFKTVDGKGFFIGGERSGKDVDRFLRTLEEGKTYEFPGVFLKGQEDQPTAKP